MGAASGSGPTVSLAAVSTCASSRLTHSVYTTTATARHRLGLPPTPTPPTAPRPRTAWASAGRPHSTALRQSQRRTVGADEDSSCPSHTPHRHMRLFSDCARPLLYTLRTPAGFSTAPLISRVRPLPLLATRSNNRQPLSPGGTLI